MTALIIDDESIHSEYLENQLKKYCASLVEVEATFQSPIKAYEYLKTNAVDFIFLDVEMDEMNAFEFIEIIGTENVPKIIFTTAFSTYAVDAFKVNAIDYLLKPIDKKELITAVEKMEKTLISNQTDKLNHVLQTPLEAENDRLILTETQGYTFVKLNNIIRIEGNGSYSDFIMLDGQRITTSKRLNFYWKKLQNLTFIRSHQSHVVNMKYIMKYSKADGGELCLTNNECVPISTRLKQSTKLKLGLV